MKLVTICMLEDDFTSRMTRWLWSKQLKENFVKMQVFIPKRVEAKQLKPSLTCSVWYHWKPRHCSKIVIVSICSDGQEILDSRDTSSAHVVKANVICFSHLSPIPALWTMKFEHNGSWSLISFFDTHVQGIKRGKGKFASPTNITWCHVLTRSRLDHCEKVLTICCINERSHNWKCMELTLWTNFDTNKISQLILIMQQTADGAADLLVLFLHYVNHPLRTPGFPPTSNELVVR